MKKIAHVPTRPIRHSRDIGPVCRTATGFECCGTSVKYTNSQRCTADVLSIWQLYLDKVANRGGISSDSPGDEYLRMKAMQLSSTDVLESNSKAGG